MPKTITKTATFVRDLEGFKGTAKLWKLSPPFKNDNGYGDDAPIVNERYVVTSAINAMFTGPETYIFPADKDGEVRNFLELEGSYRGGLSHEKAIRGMGYTIKG